MSQGPLIIVSGPSGIGKSTVVGRLLETTDLPLRASVSATTRAARSGEQDGIHYFFWTRERFEQEIVRDGFLEWAEVFGCYYGTPRAPVEAGCACGLGVVLVIDVQGAAQACARCPDAVSVFLLPPTWEVLEQRLTRRGTEGPAALQRRLTGARAELARAGEYNHQIINDDLNTTVDQLQALIRPLIEDPRCSTN